LNKKITYRPQHRCLEMENATSINQAYPAVVTNDFNYDAWGLSIETLFNPTYSSTFGSFNSPNPQRHRYNGKEQISSSRFYDYGARQYDPVIGRWLSVDPLAELDFALSAYNYVGNNPLLYIDPNGMKREKNQYGTGYDLEESEANGFVTVYASRSRWNALIGLDMYYRGHYYLKDNESYKVVKQSFRDGGAIASGVVAAPAVVMAAVELGAGAIVSYAAQYFTRANMASAGRWLLRKSIFLLKPRIKPNPTGAIADFAAQYLTNGRSFEEVNLWSVAGNLASSCPLWAGAVTTISADKKEDRTFTNFMINSAGNGLGNSPGLLFSTYSKVGLKAGTVGFGAIPRANLPGNIMSRGVAESLKKQENDN
jgi:RHS repeat-associated protein